jgi:hypothetical protein
MLNIRWVHADKLIDVVFKRSINEEMRYKL